MAKLSSVMGRQTTVWWQKQVFIRTRLSRAYLALTRLSCNMWRRHWLLDRIQLVQILCCWAMVVCCAVKTQYVASFGRQSNGPDGLSFPIGVTVCKDGKVVVCDTRSNTVKMFNSDGSVLRVIDRSVRWLPFLCCYIVACKLSEASRSC